MRKTPSRKQAQASDKGRRPPTRLGLPWNFRLLGRVGRPISAAMSEAPERPTYRWPWILLAVVVLGIVLAVLGVMREAERTKRIQQLKQGPP